MFGKSKLKAQIKELSMKVAYLEREVKVLDNDNERLKDKLAEAERKSLTPPAAVTVKRMVASSMTTRWLRFMARRPNVSESFRQSCG